MGKVAKTEKARWAAEYLGTTRKWPQHFLFPRAFVRSCVPGLPPVPAYFYHQTLIDEFPNICEELSRKGVRSLTFPDLLDGARPGSKSVLLTFDDGWSSVWSMAFPLARRHGIRFTLFVVPQSVEDSDELRPGLDDGAEPVELEARDHGDRAMLSWGEIRAMHRSGLVDIQSHSLHHGAVFVADRPAGFCRPGSPFPLNGFSPCVLREGNDVARHHPLPGTPFFPWAPALAAPRRFIDDSGVRDACIRAVAEGGGEDFFLSNDWEARLRSIAGEQPLGRWEGESERRVRFKEDLERAKREIESHVPGARIRVIAPPWGVMHPDLPAIAKTTGHELIAVAYPFPRSIGSTPLPLYPRLFGDGIWPVLRGPLSGGIAWLRARERMKLRVRDGVIP